MDTPKYIAFRPSGREHFIRGSIRSLGAEYTKERIKERIDAKLLSAPERKFGSSVRINSILQEHSSRKLLDTTSDKFEENPYLQKWANMQNLKIAASIYSDIDSVSALEKQINIKSAEAKSTRQSLHNVEHELKKMGELIKYAKQYQDNHIYQIRYQKSKDKDRYFRQHETQLLLHGGAENFLKQQGLSLQNIDLTKLRNQYQMLISRKEIAQKNFKSLEKEVKQLQDKQLNLNQYFNQTISHKQQKNHNQEIS